MSDDGSDADEADTRATTIAEAADLEGTFDARWTSYWPPDGSDLATSDGSGETVAGTSPDDVGDVTTQVVPSHVDPESLTETQAAIVEAVATNPTASRRSIADTAGCTPGTVTKTLAKLDLEVDWADRARRRGDDATADRLEAMMAAQADDGAEADGASGAEPDEPTADYLPSVDPETDGVSPDALDRARHACEVAEHIGGDAAALGAYVRDLLEVQATDA